MFRVLITGGAGFIGSILADELLKKNNFVLSVDNFDPYYSKDIKLANIKSNIENPNYKFIELDIRDTNSLKKTLEENNIEFIFHLAARPGVRTSIEDPKAYMDININGTLSVLNASLKSNVKKIIYSSSSSVYGKSQYLPLDEKHPTNPISPYGISKLTAEKCIHFFEKTYGVKSVILRYFSVYGPRQRPDEVVYKFTKLIVENKPITIYGSGNQTRDFTSVFDIVNGTILAMTKKTSSGIFNLGFGNRISVNKLISILENVTGKKTKKIYMKKQIGDVYNTLSNIQKAKKELGYKPKVDIINGVDLFYRWFKENVIGSDSHF